MSAEGGLLRIEKASIHDGAGLRNVVFLKGCPLHCAWCSTPESQSFAPELGVDAGRCVGCGRCVSACPHDALSLEEQHITIDRSKCVGCFTCVGECDRRALKAYGRRCTVEDLSREVMKDEMFYFHSGGGVTLSGGEPCAQPEFASAFLRGLKDLGVNTAIETALAVPESNVRALLPYLDHWYVDLKHMDPDECKRLTGADIDQVKSNITMICRSDGERSVVIRVPLVPGVNDGDENMRAVAHFAHETGGRLKGVELLPYHRLGHATYALLGREYALEGVELMPYDRLVERAKMLASCGSSVPVIAGERTF